MQSDRNAMNMKQSSANVGNVGTGGIAGEDTKVIEIMAPAIVENTVVNRENVIRDQVVDKEITQNHFHTTVQPVKDTQVLEAQHEQVVLAAKEDVVEHSDHEAIKRRLAAEQSKFENTTQQGETIKTYATGKTDVTERVHHNVYETIQPVVQRQTVETRVIHEVQPIVQKVVNAPDFHAASALPTMTMEQFKQQGGTLTGREARTEFMEGEPHSMIGLASGGNGGSITRGTGQPATPGAGLTSSTHTSSGATGGITGGVAGRTRSGSSSSSSSDEDKLRRGSRTGVPAVSSSGVPRTTTNASTPGSGLTSPTNAGMTGSAQTTSAKPSLLDRLNPMKDTNHDGKKGFLS